MKRIETLIPLIFVISIFTLVFLSLNFLPGSASGRTWVVDEDGSEDFISIVNAVEYADEWDTIHIRNGTYFDDLVINKGLNFTGEEGVGIREPGMPPTSYYKPDLGGGGIILGGNLTITYGGDLGMRNLTLKMMNTSDDQLTIYASGGTLRFYDCIITSADDSLPYIFKNFGYLEVVGCDVSSMASARSGPTLGGIRLYYFGVVRNCLIHHTGAYYGMGVYCRDFGVIENNMIFNHWYGIYAGTNSVIRNNSIFNTYTAFDCYQQRNPIIYNNSVWNSSGHDVFCSSNSHPIFVNTNISTHNVYTYDSSLEVRWFLDVKVIDTYGNPIQGARLRITGNENGTFDTNRTTDATGYSRWIDVPEFTVTKNDGKEYLTPLTVQAEKYGVVTNELISVHENTNLTIVLDLESEDWHITQNEELNDSNFTLSGNIFVETGGNLTIRNAAVQFKCSYDGEYGLKVKSGGALHIMDEDGNPKTEDDRSLITSHDQVHGYTFVVEYNAEFTMRNSELSYCGIHHGNRGFDRGGGYSDTSGLTIKSDGTKIVHSKFNNNYVGVNLLVSSHNIISDNTFSSNHVGISLDSSDHNTFFRNTIIENEIGMGFRESSQFNELQFNNFFDNEEFAIHAERNGFNISAFNNWWGHVSGPYHPTLNENGTGDPITDGAIFSPWLFYRNMTELITIRPKSTMDNIYIDSDGIQYLNPFDEFILSTFAPSSTECPEIQKVTFQLAPSSTGPWINIGNDKDTFDTVYSTDWNPAPMYPYLRVSVTVNKSVFISDVISTIRLDFIGTGSLTNFTAVIDLQNEDLATEVSGWIKDHDEGNTGSGLETVNLFMNGALIRRFNASELPSSDDGLYFSHTTTLEKTDVDTGDNPFVFTVQSIDILGNEGAMSEPAFWTQAGASGSVRIINPSTIKGLSMKESNQNPEPFENEMNNLTVTIIDIQASNYQYPLVIRRGDLWNSQQAEEIGIPAGTIFLNGYFIIRAPQSSPIFTAQLNFTFHLSWDASPYAFLMYKSQVLKKLALIRIDQDTGTVEVVASLDPEQEAAWQRSEFSIQYITHETGTFALVLLGSDLTVESITPLIEEYHPVHGLPLEIAVKNGGPLPEIVENVQIQVYAQDEVGNQEVVGYWNLGTIDPSIIYSNNPFEEPGIKRLIFYWTTIPMITDGKYHNYKIKCEVDPLNFVWPELDETNNQFSVEIGLPILNDTSPPELTIVHPDLELMTYNVEGRIFTNNYYLVQNELVTFTGVAQDDNFIVFVQYKFDGSSDWILASGNETWSATFTFSNDVSGLQGIRFRTFDGFQYSEEEYVVLDIQESVIGGDDGDDKDPFGFYVFLGILFILFIALGALIFSPSGAIIGSNQLSSAGKGRETGKSVRQGQDRESRDMDWSQGIETSEELDDSE